MFRVFNCLTEQHDWRLVVVACIVCFAAALTAVSLFHRAHATKGRTCLIWIAAAGLMVGCGIWATHFIAMLAYEPGVFVAYNVGLTALSLLTAVVITAIGLAIAARSKARWAPHIGGAIVGGGVAGMHYMGMWALEVPGHVMWSMDLVAASIALGMLFGMAALAVAIRDEEFDGIDPGRRIAHARHRVASLHRHGRSHGRPGSKPHGQRVLAIAGLIGRGDRRRDPGSARFGHGRRLRRSPAREAIALRHGPEQHVAGAVHVVAHRPPDPVQRALHPDVSTRTGADARGRVAARTARPPHQGRHLLRQSRPIHRRSAHQRHQGQDRDLRARARGPLHQHLQPADGRRRLGRHPRGHHRAAAGRASALLARGAGKPPRHDRGGDRGLPRARRDACSRA